MEIKVLKDILGANELIAEKNHNLLVQNRVFTVNIMSTPGAGKTSLILKTIHSLKNKVKIGVIEGDVSSSMDAELVGKEGVPVIQINTGGGCHLDANMVSNALGSIPLPEIDLLFVENVGNLVCPAEFNIGEHHKAMIISTTEGDDKPEKYPIMFQVSQVLLLNKIDLLPHLSFNMERFREEAHKVNPRITVMPISCTTGEGLETWFRWLEDKATGKS